MGQKLEYEAVGEEVYLAGEKVLPGRYKQMGGVREVLLEAEDILPASLDGQVAVYMREIGRASCRERVCYAV